jgi:hypothetical protein
MATAEPRSKLSTWLTGFVFGPFILTLWLGRGRLAGLYLLIYLIVVGLAFLALMNGFCRACRGVLSKPA